MDKTQVQLTDGENSELREGQELYEMTKTAGFKVLEEKLKDLAFHSWVDPREVKDKAEWEWRELNGFHAANAAKELLGWIAQAISRSDFLEKKKTGQIDTRRMKI